MSRLDELERKVDRLSTKKKRKKKQKQFEYPKVLNKLSGKADKKIDSVVVQYLTAKNQVQWKLCKVIAGNLVVVRNKVHVLNPKMLWRYKNKMWYILREIDRRPVSNMDYEAVRAAKQDTDADVPLIKAVLGAIQKQDEPKKNKNAIIIGALIVIAAIIVFAIVG